MKKKKDTEHGKQRIHTSREDRGRTNAGKTVISKVRSEGRTLAARERSALVPQAHKADEAKEKFHAD